MRSMTAPDLFQVQRDQWMKEARGKARGLLMIRPSITITDVLEVCPYPTYLGKKKSLLGMLFQTDDFERLGFTRSRTKISHGHVIGVWGLSQLPESPLIRRKRFIDYGS